MGCSQSQAAQETNKPVAVAGAQPAPSGGAVTLTRTSSKYDSNDPELPSKTLSKSSSFKELKGLSIGQQLLCRDEFRSKYTGEWMAKWRAVEVIDLSLESKRIYVHFVGWSDAFDIWVDLATELHKVCALELLTKEERDRGTSLDNNQLKQMQTYIHTGSFIPATLSKKISFKNDSNIDSTKPTPTIPSSTQLPSNPPPHYTSTSNRSPS
ncbi:hypothetical protein EON65_57380, partial [archaeon]